MGKPVTSDIDPYADAFLAEPWSDVATLRDAAPAVGLVDLTIGEPWRRPSILVEADPPEHTTNPRKWIDPDRFDIARKATGHLGWGIGAHVCVGMVIARMEGESVLNALSRRTRTLEMTGPATPRLNNTLRGLDSLPLQISPN